MKNNFVWQDIATFGGRYKINGRGHIMSIRRAGSAGRILKQSEHKGYRRVGLYSGKKLINFAVHRLVAQAFIPNPQDKPFINHKDGNRRNNSVENLEWCTAKENYNHSVEVLGRNGSGKDNGHFGYSVAKLYPSEELRNRLVELGVPRYKHNLAELGEMLPARITNPITRNMDFGRFHKGDDSKQDNRNGYTVEYHTSFSPPLCRVTADTEVNARAKMLIYLIENNLIDK